VMRMEYGKTRVPRSKLYCLKSNLNLVFFAAHRKAHGTGANPYAGQNRGPAYLQGKGELPTGQAQEMSGRPKGC
jgi:hypothetical protein